MTNRNIVEQIFNDAIKTIRQSQNDLEKTISGFASGISSRPLIDIIENSNDITVIADLPGFIKENIRLDISEASLEISARFQGEILEEGSTYIRRERNYDELKRFIELPVRIQIDKSRAEYENGVLKVIMPKLEQDQGENYKVTINYR